MAKDKVEKQKPQDAAVPTSPAQEAKFLAEARKADADAEMALVSAGLRKAIDEAEIGKLVAETRKANSEADNYDELRKQASATATVMEITRQRVEREEAETLAGDRYNFVYQFDSPVSGTSVASCVKQLTMWSRVHPGEPFEIVFNSPGGGIIEGMALFDFLMQLKRKGHYLTTNTLGYAASMAGILLQAGDVRAMGKESYLLIHEISFGASGKIGEIEDEVEFVKKVQKRVIAIFAERSKMTKGEIAKRWKRRDWWLSSDEAMKLGLIDEIR